MATPIPSIVKDQLLSIYSDKMKRGDLTSPDRLREIYEQFRDRFGPQRLAAMDGEALLMAMHAHGNHDSLVYWLGVQKRC